MRRACVTGAGGFIGSHLVRYLKERGYWVRAVDIKPPQWSDSPADELWLSDWDLRSYGIARMAIAGCDEIYALAADMGGMGYISQHHFTILRNNSLININTAEACREAGTERVLFTSSACVYPERLQLSEEARNLHEDDAWNGAPDTAYGIEKLFSEEIYTRLAEDTDAEIRIARFHNIFGPEGSWNDGREKLPAAACRKVAMAKVAGDPRVEVWGDGQATRSFCYIDDCLEMLYRLMKSDYAKPMNIGTDRSVSVDQMFGIAARAAGIRIELIHVLGPQGVRGRNADLSLMREVLDYEPQTSLEGGMERLYQWIEDQLP